MRYRSISFYKECGDCVPLEQPKKQIITLKGQWLKELGFDIGDYVSISCENGKLVITPDVERAAVAEAETAFMEREIQQ